MGGTEIMEIKKFEYKLLVAPSIFKLQGLLSGSTEYFWEAISMEYDPVGNDWVVLLKREKIDG
jgi:hypothetical protein